MKNIIIAILVTAVLVLGISQFLDSEPENPSGTNPQSTVSPDNSSGNDDTSKDRKSLANSGLQTVPMNLFEDSSITALDLSGNTLTGALPAEIGKLSNLETLDASDNNLTGVPAEVGQLSKLRVINFANNDISGLPLELGNLSKLETLDLRGNPNISTYDLNLIQPEIPNASILTDN